MIWILWTLMVWAGPQEAYDRALLAERTGDYAGAVEAYRESLAQGGRHSAVYHGIGNAWLRLGHTGPAINAYRRALRLDPSNADVAANLSFAQKSTPDRLDAPELDVGPFFWQRSLAPRRSLLWASGLWTAALGGIATDRWFPSLAPLRSKMRLVAALCAVLGSLLLVSTAWVWKGVGSAVVVVPQVTAASTMGTDAVALFELREGAEVRVVERTEQAWLVALPDERRGWIPVDALWDTAPDSPLPTIANATPPSGAPPQETPP